MRYLIFDTETGGINPDEDALISVGAILLDKNLQTITTFYTLLQNNYNKKISEIALEVNGIKEEMFEDALSIKEFQAIWNYYLLPKADIVIGHNIAFDIKFMLNHAAMIENTLDTMHLCWDVWPGEKAKLGMVYERIGKTAENAHNALYDCEMVADLLRWMVENNHITLPLPSYPVVNNYFEHKAFGYKKMKEKGLL